MAEATDDKDLLALQSAFENKRVLGKLGEFREFGEEQAKSLNAYFALMKDKFGVNAGSTYDTGKLISEGEKQILSHLEVSLCFSFFAWLFCFPTRRRRLLQRRLWSPESGADAGSMQVARLSAFSV